jgi:CMP-N,N'-diacetyllegionaminic acid synthase
LVRRADRMKVLGVIPARGGSKGIPRKNLAQLGGRPLLEYTIDAARGSQRLSRTVLSTDDQEIAAVGKELGVEVPFVRPAHLASDSATSASVLQHALKQIEEQEGRAYDLVVLLQPSSPFRSAADIDRAVELLDHAEATSVVSVTTLEEPHPVKVMVMDDGVLKPFLPQYWRETLRRQDLTPVYRLNGAIYGVTRDVVQNECSLWGMRTLAYEMPPERSLNIDTPWDLRLAEAVLRTLRSVDDDSR